MSQARAATSPISDTCTQTDPSSASSRQMNKDLIRAYLSLAKDGSLWEAPLEDIRRSLVKHIAESLSVDRVSIWTFCPDSTILHTDCLYDLDKAAYSSGATLDTNKYPGYGFALQNNRFIAASDAKTDRRFLELCDDYLIPNRITSMLDVCLRTTGVVQGVICIEQIVGTRVWRKKEIDYVCSVSDLYAQLLTHLQSRDHERKLSDFYALQKAILESASYSIIGTDKDGRIVLFNKAAEQMLGYCREEVLGQPPSTIHDHDEMSARAKELSKELGYPVPPSFEVFVAIPSLKGHEEREWTYIRRNGSRFPVRLSVTVLYDQQHKLTGYLGIATDITQAQQTRRAMQNAERRYRTLFESSTVAVVVGEHKFPDLTITDCNAAALEMFRCAREKLIGLKATQLQPEHLPDGRLWDEQVVEMESTLLRGTEATTFEWQYQRLNGEQFQAEVTFKALELDGSPHYLATIRDISVDKAQAAALSHSEQEHKERNRILGITNALAEEILSARQNEQDIARLTLRSFEEALGCEYAVFSYIRDDQVKERTFLRRGEPYYPKISDDRWASLGRQAFATNRTQICESLHDDPRISEARYDLFQSLGLKSLVCIPISMHGTCLGIVSLFFSGQIALPSSINDICTPISRMIAMALTNVRQMSKLDEQVHHDSLTHLPNRQALYRAFTDMTTREQPIKSGALLLMDLDRFKEINDTLGHHIGDFVLSQIASRLEIVSLSFGGIACRLGGDEFALFLPDIRDHSDAIMFAIESTHKVRTPCQVEGMSLSVSSSIGISIFPTDGSTIHDLLRTADVAMYEAKQRGSGYLLYDRHADRHSPERLVLNSELGNAIANGELRVHFQPKIALDTRKVVGFEALTRWQHPKLGLIGPAQFMPLAEVSELIHPFTQEILRLSLEQQKLWRTHGHSLSVAVNLSTRNLVDERLIRKTERLLQIFEMPPADLELEITETTLMADPEGAAKKLRLLADIGVKVSIDDFGTGYSSLGYLRHLPIDKLKIDRSFIQELARHEADATIVRSIVNLAHSLGMDVVAEGVEDETTSAILEAIGCDQAQGYLISPPLPAESVLPWLASWEHGGKQVD